MADIFDIALGKALESAAPSGGAIEPSGVFDALINQESGGKQFDKSGKPLTSKAGAIGRAQLMPATAPEAAKLAGLEYDEMRYRNDPEYNTALGRAYFNKQLEDFGGDTQLALAAYNAGPQRVRNAVATAEKAGNPGAWLQYLPRETQQYVPSIVRKAGAPSAQGGQFVTPTGGEYVGPGKARESATIADIGKEVAASFIEGVGSIAQLPGEVGAAVMNKVTGTQDYESKNLLKPVAEGIRGTMTEGGQQARAGANVEGSVIDLATGNAELPENLDSWFMMGANGFGSLLTTVLPLVGPARRVAALTEAAKAAEAAGDVAKAAELVRAAQSAAARSKAIGTSVGAGMTGGAAAEEVRQTAAQAVGQMSHEQLLQNVPAYAEVFTQTGDQNQARQAVVNSAAQWAGALAGVAGGVGGAINAKVFEDFLVKKGVAAMVGNSVSSRLGRGAIAGGGGALAESGQETSEKVGQNMGENIALGRAPTDNALRNTAGDALGGALIGGPVGFGGGVMTSPTQNQPPAPVVPPALQPVVAQAQKPGSVLSRAAVAGATAQGNSVAPQGETAPQPAPTNDSLGQTGQAGGANVAPEMGNTASPMGPGPSSDPFAQKAAELEGVLRGQDLIRSVRTDGAGLQGIIFDLNTMRDPNARPDIKAAAQQRIEEEITWAQVNYQPKPKMDTVASTPGFEQPSDSRGPREAQRQDVMGLEVVQATLRDPQLGPKVSPNDRQTILQLATTAQNPSLPLATRQQAADQAIELVGRYRAAVDTSVAPQPTVTEQPAPAAESVVTPEPQQTVAQTEQTQPAVSQEEQRTPAGTGPAVNRRRSETLGQLVQNGFETVKREDDGSFYLINSATGQRFKLDNMGDAQIARNLINKTLEAKANEAAASPTNDLKATDAMKAAGNVKTSTYDLNGFKLRIAFPAGSERTGTSPDGEMWKRKMTADYGDIEGVRGADGDKMDVFVGPRRDTDKIFVVDQVNEDGSFDEHKVIMGAASEDQARQVYLSNYPQGWTGLGGITQMTPEQFRAWAKSPAAKKPAAKQTATPAKAAQEPRQQGRFATLDAAKAYISAQKQAGGAISGLPLQLADGSFTVAAKGTPEYAEAQRQRDAEQVQAPAQGEFFTVPDGGKQKRLKKVKKGAMPKKSSVRREGRSIYRSLSQDDATLLEQIAAILGKDIVFFESQDGRLSDGFVMPGAPKTIYVATETSVNPLSIFGHEFFHTLRETNPAAWDAIAAVVKAKAGQEAFDRMQKLGYSADESLEEFVSDLGGDLLSDPTFWKSVFAQIQKDNGKEAKGIIARLAAAIEHMLGKLLSGINQGGYGADEFVSDMDAVKAAFSQAMASYLRDAGISKSAMDSEIKKSVIRVSAEQKALEEYAAVDAEYRNTDKWMKAPNGEPTKLSERQWVQVRTPSFKNWFGDWEKFAGMQGGVWNDASGEVSKVVDENGEPLVVYHGTTDGGFSIFKEPGGKARGDLGIFTTPNLEMAKTYISRGRAKEVEFDNMDREPLNSGENTETRSGYYASFVNMRNPYESDFEGAYWNGDRPGQYVVLDEDGEQLPDRDGKMYFESESEAEEVAAQHGDAEVKRAPDHYETTDSVVREARAYQNDGAIIRSVVDSGSGFSGYLDEPSDVFVALHPGQLKSATQNTGEFSKRSNDMRFSVDRASDIDPNGYNEFTATPEDIAKADAYEAENGIRPYLSAGQLQVNVQVPQIRKSIKRPYDEKAQAKGKVNHPILGVPLNANGTVTLYVPATNDEARRIARERTLKAPPGGNRVYLTNESEAQKVSARPGNISELGDDIQAAILVHVDPDLLHIDQRHDDGRIDFFIPVAEGEAFNRKMSQWKMFNLFAERTEPITREKSLKDIENSIAKAMKRIDEMPEAERKKAVRRAEKVLKDEHNVSKLLTENGKLLKTRVGEFKLDYDGQSVYSLGLGLASAQQITEKLSSCPQHANCEQLCLGDTAGQNLLYGGDGPFRAGPRLSQYLKTEAMVLHPEEFALVLHNEIKAHERWCDKDTGFETVKDEEGNSTKVPKQVYKAALRLNVTSDFRPMTWKPMIESFPGVEFYDYTKLDVKPVAPNHHLTYSSDGVAQIVDGVAIGDTNYNWNRMLRQLRNGFNVAMAFSDKNSIPKLLIDAASGERFQVWDGDNYDARFLDPKPGQEGNLFNKGMIVGLTNKDRTKSGLAIMLDKEGPASASKAEWTNIVNRIASDEAFLNDKSVQYVLTWLRNQKGDVERKALVAFADSPAVKHNGFFIDYDPKRDGDTVVIGDQERTLDEFGKTRKSIQIVPKFSRDRASVTNSKAFKAWFGDSKVVDSKGEPLVVYHGTSTDAGVEDIGILSFNSADNLAAWFTSSPNKADDYANRYDVTKRGESGAQVYAAFLSIKNPLIVEGEIQRPVMESPGFVSLARSLAVDVDFDGNDGFVWQELNQPEFIEAAIAAGYDGIFATESGQQTFAAFRPEQIKSATGNNGEFDGTNPDIRKSADRTNTAAFKKWFGDSKVVDAEGRPLVVYHGTNADFSVFDPESQGSSGQGSGESGFFFEASPDNAGLYTRQGSGGNVMPVYLSLKNPLIVERTNAKYDYDGSYNRVAFANFIDDALEAGHDGVIFRDVLDRGKRSAQYIAFNPTQIKSATGNNGEFDPANPDIRKSLPRPAFFSQLQSVIAALPARLSTMSASQWKQWLKANAPKNEIKAEEIEWSGINEFLYLKKDAKVTKDEIVAYLDESGIRVSEVIKGNDDPYKRFAAKRFGDLTEEEKQDVPGFSYAEDGDWVVYFDGEAKGAYDAVNESQAIEMVAGDMDPYFIGSDETKYEKYQLPGAKNYREVLLTLPKGSVPALQFKVGDEVEGPSGKGVITRADPNAKGKPYEIKYPGGGSGYLYQNQIKGAVGDMSPADFESGHWKEENVLAHIRINDRNVEMPGFVVRNTKSGNASQVFETRAQAEAYQQGLPATVSTEIVERPRQAKVLFVEEIQSDWAQEGRKQGFGGLNAKEVDELQELTEQEENYGLTDEEQERKTELEEKDDMPIPRGPFVGKTDAWVDLTLKRIAMLAVEGGYDAVAFVNGEQSADRYDLSKEIDGVNVELHKGRYLLTAQRGGNLVMSENLGSSKKIADYIGKELAERLLAKLDAAKPTERGSRTAELSGLDMKVGGEGMVKFYNEIVPQRVSKLLPKIGGEKLTSVRVGGSNVQPEVTRASVNGNEEWRVWDANDNVVARFKSELEALDYVRNDATTLAQPGFDVTDKMRETVSRGMPLFSRDRKATDSVDTDTYNQRIAALKNLISCLKK